MVYNWLLWFDGFLNHPVLVLAKNHRLTSSQKIENFVPKHSNKKALIKNNFKIVFAHINNLLCLCKHCGVILCSHT